MGDYLLRQTGQEVQDILNQAPETQEQLDAEEVSRGQADQLLDEKILAEKTRAEGAEAALQEGKQDVLTFDEAPTEGSDNPVKSAGIYNAIKGILDLVPEGASAENKLTDHASVSAEIAAKIAAATQEWKGQYDTLEDLEAVEAKTGDMGCVKSTDSDGHVVIAFYQYSAEGEWSEYYTLRHYGQNKPATTGDSGAYPFNGMGRIELPKNEVRYFTTWMFLPVHPGGDVYLLYSPDGETVYGIYNSATEKGLGFANNVVAEVSGYSTEEMDAITGGRYLSYTEAGGVFTITLPDSSTITSTQLNQMEIFRYEEGGNAKKNVLTQSMMMQANTIYVIQYDYYLGGAKNYEGYINITENSILLFDGGSFKGGNIAVYDNTQIIGGNFDDVTIFVFGSNVTIKDCKFTNTENVTRSTDNNTLGYVIRAVVDNNTTPVHPQVEHDLEHVVIDNCTIEDNINIPISIDDLNPDSEQVSDGYKFNYITISNCVIKARYVAITLAGRNERRQNNYAEICNNSIYYTGEDTSNWFFAVSVEPMWNNVTINNNYLEGLQCVVELPGSNNINISNNTLTCVGDYSVNPYYYGVWISSNVRYDGTINISNNDIVFLHTPPVGASDKNAYGIFANYAIDKINIYSNRLKNCSLRFRGNISQGDYLTSSSVSEFNIANNSIETPDVITSAMELATPINAIVRSIGNVYKIGNSHVASSCVSYTPITSFYDGVFIYANHTKDSFVRPDTPEGNLNRWIKTSDVSKIKTDLAGCTYNTKDFDVLLSFLGGSTISLASATSNYDIYRNKMLFWLDGRWCDANGRLGKVYVAGADNRLPSPSELTIGKDLGLQFFHASVNKPIYLKNITGTGAEAVATWVESDGAVAKVKRSGATADRPLGTDIYVGFMFFDTSLSPARPIYASAISGSTVTWVDATGATV